MAMSNRERVGRALDLLGKGIQPFFEREMVAHYGDDWTKEAAKSFERGIKAKELRDVYAVLKIMWDQWNIVFGKVLGRTERTLVSELREDRNRWAHQESFSFDDAYRTLDSAFRLLSAVSAGDEASEIDRLRQELMRLRYEEGARKETKKAAALPLEVQPSAGLSPWRDVVTPHPDVASGRYSQAEFAADLGQVRRGEASSEYGDPRQFFERTFITEGMEQLLKLALERLTDKGGAPVVELQTTFGGGKTHSLLALYHMASGVPVEELPGIEPIVKSAGLTDPPKANRAVLVGTQISPGQPHIKDDGTEIRTLWGELAYQLGGKKGYDLVAGADRNASNPGDSLRELLKKYSPCLILIDEWVAYARQLHSSNDLPGGTFDTQFTFVQSLTEAAHAVPGALVVVSLPESDIEKGGQAGEIALERLKHVIHRVQSPWRPATMTESFEIVRRRLFQEIAPDVFAKRDGVIKGFAEMYRTQAAEFPSKCKETEYRRQIEVCYPIHPELFEQLYGGWSTLDKFQRTRGVLRLMAKVIHTLWESEDRSLLIMPGAVPVGDSEVYTELTTYLDDPWVPVIETDVDGPNSLPLRLDRQNAPNFGRYSATRRVARTIYMGSAPTLKAGQRGVEQTSIILGCVQPGENVAIFGDALRRLSAQATHLYQQQHRYWYSTQPSVNRLAQDRADQFDTDNEIDVEIVARLKRQRSSRGEFEGVHIEGEGEVPDEMEARLVILAPTSVHSAKETGSAALTAAAAILDKRANQRRTFRNSVLFSAADRGRLEDLRQAVRTFLAWKSISEEREQLNLDAHQTSQAEQKLKEAEEVVAQRLTDTYQWLLVPYQPEKDSVLEWTEVRLTGQDSLVVRASKKAVDEEHLYVRLGGTRLRLELDRVPLWRGNHVELRQLREDFARYTYLPRLRDVSVLIAAVSEGVSSMTWESDTFAYAEGFDEAAGRYRDLRAAQQASVMVEGGSVLVKPEVARKQLDEESKVIPPEAETERETEVEVGGDETEAVTPQEKRVRLFYGRKNLEPVRMTRDVAEIAEHIVSHLESLSGARVEISLEITANLEEGAPPETVRTVTENARTLKLDQHGFEES